MIKDTYHRTHDYLRISLTDVCNLRCFYCMPEEDYDFTPESRLMQVDEITRIARTFVDMGVTKIRLTGGEPLARKDAAEILKQLSDLPVTLTMTTNATLLHRYMDILEGCGVRSLNISLDTLKPEKFLWITRRKQFRLAMDNIHEAVRRGFHVKINAVIMKGLNDNELLDFVSWTRDYPVHVRFIEFMPFNGNRWTSNQVFTWKEMLEVIATEFPYEHLQKEPHDTAKKYRVPGHKGTFAVISTMSAPFCSGCNRMRLTADGKMKNCLFSRGETDLLSALRNGEDLEFLIRSNILQKARGLGGQMGEDFKKLDGEKIDNRSMISIGG
ncbi:cyclic pyranopterin phosphate synthase [Sinomicrobium oceani]|uniref:GTP 3',8-cyclase n=1 Tax=Sinomicrobium oceani TaxID=1150368 RepID=A0A1K1QKQ0_9FLAO|nr:GTP 3',8-cyclase MoaA [Sinomicrobium oceani]SFW59806.1 cyclic pyranopterin phosphate synthase [Sinomicrobium oceani]